MNQDKGVYFADGQRILITEMGVRSRSVIYPLDKIYSYKVSVVTPSQILVKFGIGIGILIFMCGALNFLPGPLKGSISVLGINVLINAIIMVSGILFVLGSMLILVLQKKKYRITLSTPKGEETIVVSSSSDYVNGIVTALSQACLDFTKRTRANGAKQHNGINALAFTSR